MRAATWIRSNTRCWAWNELVAEDVDVIALHPNHSEALESVLGAARGVGIQVCAWECPVTEESFDVYVEGAAEVPAAVQELLEKL